MDLPLENQHCTPVRGPHLGTARNHAYRDRDLSMIIYNLFPLLAGPLSQWGRHFSRAAEMRFEWIFLNPIQKTGASRSLYSVADYFAINPDLLDPSAVHSADDQVRVMIAEAPKSGLR